MAPPSTFTVAAAVAIHLVVFFTSARGMRHRSLLPVEASAEGAIMGDDDDSHAAAGQPLPELYRALAWIQQMTDHVNDLTERAQKMSENLENNVAAETRIVTQQLVQQMQAVRAQAQQATVAATQQDDQAFDEFQRLLRSKRSAPYYADAAEQMKRALQVSYAAALPGLQQMNELLRIRNGAPLHSVQLPGFPSHLFRRGGFSPPGLFAGLQLGQEMLQMSMALNAALNEPWESQAAARVRRRV